MIASGVMTADGTSISSAVPGPPYRVPCERLPAALPSGRLQLLVHHDASAGQLHVAEDLSPAELVQLRNQAGNDADWQLVIDQLAARMEAAQTSRASSFPPTMWGLLLGELGSGDEAAWKRFMGMYRVPVSRVISGMLARTGRRGDPAELAEDFFTWFFVDRTFDRLVRVSQTGHVNRFRGFLAQVLKTFLRQTFTPDRKATPSAEIDTGSDPELDPAHLVDRELIREAVFAELDVIRSYHRSLWRALMLDFSGLTLEAVSQRLRDEGVRRGGSVAAVHRERQKARDVLRHRLIRYRLRHGTLTEEEAVDEYLQLLPFVADAIVEYVGQNDAA